MRLDHESLRYPETDILKYHEYTKLVINLMVAAAGLTFAL